MVNSGATAPRENERKKRQKRDPLARLEAARAEIRAIKRLRRANANRARANRKWFDSLGARTKC